MTRSQADPRPPGAGGPYDLIVVGGGAGGCVVAARASEDPGRRVLLVEGGPDPQPVPDVIADPKRQGELIRETPFVRRYEVERRDGSRFPLISGRVMGGGSAVNNMSVIRPIRRDFDAWTAYGGPAWSYDALLPTMRAIEDDPDFGDGPLHGRGGPLRLHRRWKLDDPADPPVAAIVAAATDLGLPRCDDLNVPEPFGICSSPYSEVDGRRQSVVDAYLEAARGRPNLTIMADTPATRLILDGRRAAGVELATAGGPATVLSERVVLSAGAYHTPQLLMLSGIGPPDAIEAVRLRVVHRLDGVGRNFQDHAVVGMAFAATDGMHDDYAIPNIRLIAKSRPDLPYGDLHVFLRPPARVAGRAMRLPVSIRLLDHRSRGRIRLASADPAVLPAVDPAILRDPGDVSAVLDAMRFVTTLVEHPATAAYYGPLVTPGAGTDWEDHVLSTWITYNHAVGTCRMGGADDPLAVVDPELRVRGIDDLWIADVSVLPVIPHATTQLSAILVGELVAGAIARA